MLGFKTSSDVERSKNRKLSKTHLFTRKNQRNKQNWEIIRRKCIVNQAYSRQKKIL